MVRPAPNLLHGIRERRRHDPTVHAGTDTTEKNTAIGLAAQGNSGKHPYILPLGAVPAKAGTLIALTTINGAPEMVSCMQWVFFGDGDSRCHAEMDGSAAVWWAQCHRRYTMGYLRRRNSAVHRENGRGDRRGCVQYGNSPGSSGLRQGPPTKTG